MPSPVPCILSLITSDNQISFRLIGMAQDYKATTLKAPGSVLAALSQHDLR
jgi:hypothetical protein